MSSRSAADAALDTLFLPFASGRLAWPPAGALFLRARYGAPLQHHWSGLVCEQSFKPDADALLRAGCALSTATDISYPLVLLLPPRQRDEARALLARAVLAVQPGGIVVAAMKNLEGARSGEDDLASLAGPLTTLVKNKCRVFWTAPLPEGADLSLAREWLTLDAVRPIENGRFVSRPGIFAWNRIDPGSRLLAEHLPATLRGAAADLGAGFGFLSSELLQRCPGITSLDVFEAEGRALDLARLNLDARASRAALRYHWHDVTAGLPDTYDVIVTNPPFHGANRDDRPDIGRRFITVAAESLKAGGSLWLVANRHLPYEEALHDRFATVTAVAQRDGFKVIAAIRAPAS